MARLSACGRVIMVIDCTLTEAAELKELIEFMDEPEVRTATPTLWRQRLGDDRLGAVFIGKDLSELDVRTVVDGVGALDPNTPIVMLHDSA